MDVLLLAVEKHTPRHRRGGIVKLSLDIADGKDGTLKLLTPEEIEPANARQQALLHDVTERGSAAFKGSKPHTGELSPGCRLCGEGLWSCMFLNNFCNATCFFCPGLVDSKDVPPYAERMVFDSPHNYADYIEKFGFKGVSFSGGEPFLTTDKLVEYLTVLRDHFGSDLYIWAYTNGIATTAEKLERAVEAGLDEVRYNIVATDYRLDDLRRAVGIVPRVTVEIPAIPEDNERFRSRLSALREAGVDHLNLHQLMLLGENGEKLNEQGYTFTRHPTPAVIESELSALETMRYALDEGIELPINYCSLAFKERWQHLAEDRRAVPLVMRGYEATTDYGLVRRIWLKCAPDRAHAIAESLRAGGASEGSWFYSAEETALYLHPDLLPQVDLSSSDVFVTYLKTVLGERETQDWARRLRDYHEVELNPSMSVGARLVPLNAPVQLSAEEVKGILDGRPPETVRGFEIVEAGLYEYR